MIHVHHNRFIPIVLLSGILLSTACTDKWSEHYDETSFNLPDKTLTALIQERPELSIFSGMLKKTAYDKVLDASQSYTVWAPINDALQGIDTTNEILVRQIVRNHITRSRITTSGISNETVRMLNGKYIYFRDDGGTYTFGGFDLTEVNVPASNGLLHVIDGYAPYISNLWEYLGEKSGLDSVSTYIYGESKSVFDPVNSIEIGVNSSGQVIYDSVFILSNKILEQLGAIDIEDSIYSIVMPDNAAWNEAYARIEPYFNFPEDGGDVIRQRDETRWTLIQDAFFRGYVQTSGGPNTIISTWGNAFYNPGNLFGGMVKDSLSNGLAYIASTMPFSDTSSWYKEIRIEAEDLEGRTSSNNVLFQRTSFGTGLKASNDRYILADPTSSESSVKFSIPNTLSAKYNIYCVFVPASIVDPSNTIPTKASFVLTYIRRASGSTFIKKITPDINYTFPYGLTKMFVDQFEFEYANKVNEEYTRVAVKLEVVNDVTSDEEQSGKFSRTMRIDCIILEPVIE